MTEGMKLNTKIEIQSHGRYGSVIYQKNSNTIELYWEMSGSKKYAILLAPLDLRKWQDENEIPINEQLEILADLRCWLKRENIKTDIDLPEEIELENKVCIHSGCNETRIKNSAYCLRHYNESLLKL